MTDIEEELTPAYRAKKLRAAMDELYDEAAPDDALTDLLADARHFADAHGLAFAEHDRRAQEHYSAEMAALSPFLKEEELPTAAHAVSVESTPYTVLLLYPDTLAENYGTDTYLAHVEAVTPAKAVHLAQKEANLANRFNWDDPVFTEDFLPLLTIAGKHKDVTP